MPENNPYDFPGINVKWGQAAGGYLSGTYPNPNVAKIKGTITNDNATAGDVGEYVESEILVGSAAALTSTVTANITSISLTAGDWDIWGNVAVIPAATTTTSIVFGAISITSATFPTAPNKGAYTATYGNATAGTTTIVSVGMKRISITATTTIYLVINVTFGVSTCSAYGAIAARRIR